MTTASTKALSQAHLVNSGHAVMDYVAFCQTPGRKTGRIYAFTIDHGEGSPTPRDWASIVGDYDDYSDVLEAARRGGGEGVDRIRRKIKDRQ